MAKLIIISAPSGTGKSTIIRELQKRGDLNLQFSISATSRELRQGEEHGREYYFFSPAEFRQHIEQGDFLEWEEVYTDKYYGTLKSEVDRILSSGANVIFDIDYVGGLNLKKIYGEQALALFIKPPLLESLKKRLESRGTDSQEIIQERLNKAEEEISHSNQFDLVFVNDELDSCVEEIHQKLKEFISSR